MNLKPKKCTECKRTFQPSGPRSLRCNKCKGAKDAKPFRNGKPTSPRRVSTTVANPPVEPILSGEDRSFPRPLEDSANAPVEAHDAEVVSEAESAESVREEARPVDPQLREGFYAMLCSGCEMYNGALKSEGIPAPSEEAYKPLCLLWTKCAERFGLFEIVEDDKWYLLAMSGIGTVGIYGSPTYELVKRSRAKRTPKPGPIPFTTAVEAPPAPEGSSSSAA